MRPQLAGCVLAMVMLATAAPVAMGDTATPFNGMWSTNDFDGSRLTVAFAPSGTERRVSYTDWRATTCGGGVWEATGTGVIDGATLVLESLGGCAGEAPDTPLRFSWTVEGSALLDQDGFVWGRTGVLDAFSGVWRSVDGDGSLQTLTLAGSGLTRQVLFIDLLATSCDPDALFIAHGTGVIGSTPGYGRFMEVTLTGGCANQPEREVPAIFEYRVWDNTLDGVGVTWFR